MTASPQTRPTASPRPIAPYEQVWSPTCLAGRVAVVTGTSGGVGAEAVRALAAVGARVYAFSRGDGPADLPAGVTTLHADAGDETQIRRAVDEVAAREGHVDIAVANAARYTTRRFTELDTGTWLDEIGVNLNGPFYLFRAVLDHLAADGRDRSLVAIGSTAGERGGSLGHVPYGVAKSGLQGLAKGLAREVGEQGVRVNVLALGTVAGTVNAQEAVRLKGADYGRASGLRRPAHVSEIAHAIIYLSSPAASFVTGTVMRIDGGGLYG
ncbi:MAG TPA: SDR family oxidoreductase [Mycobacteriales bacterium]|jgi:3-oxoacyl-[acyl-carrier protein] reductase|nr:SDR family oxidoreductase [Mycobacteriales bacterium]